MRIRIFKNKRNDSEAFFCQFDDFFDFWHVTKYTESPYCIGAAVKIRMFTNKI